MALEGTILFTSVGRAHYGFDIYAVSVPQTLADLEHDCSVISNLQEVKLTDGASINYNGCFVEGEESRILWNLLSDEDPKGLEKDEGILVYISERNKSPRVHCSSFHEISDDSISRQPQHTTFENKGLVSNMKDLVIRSSPSVNGDNRNSKRVSQSRSLFAQKGPVCEERPSVRGGRIVFASTHEPNESFLQSWTAVYSARLDDRKLVRLTPPGLNDFSPAISPSGKWVAVGSPGEEGWRGEMEALNLDLYALAATDGSQRRLLIKDGGWPSWADEHSIYFHRRGQDGWWSIYKLTLPKTFFTTGEGEICEERVTPPGIHAFTPAASPKGDWIAVATRRPYSKFRQVELYDTQSHSFIILTERTSPGCHHFNPFVSSSGKLGYHRPRAIEGQPSECIIPSLEIVDSQFPRLALVRVDGAFPCYSPDCAHIAFLNAADFNNVYVMNSDGSDRRLIFRGMGFGLAWDKKRKGIVYASAGGIFQSSRTEVHIIAISNADGEGEHPWRQLTKSGTGNNAFPSPSPDGKHIVFRSGRSGNKNLWIMDVNGEEHGLRQLTDGPWVDTMCNWSSDGEWIVFSSNRVSPSGGFQYALYLVRPDGTGLRKVVPIGRNNHPIFSPDCKTLVFTAAHAGISAEPISHPNQFQPYGEIHIVDVDGQNVRRLTHNPYENGVPDWGATYTSPPHLSNAGSPFQTKDTIDPVWLTYPDSNIQVRTWCNATTSNVSL